MTESYNIDLGDATKKTAYVSTKSIKHVLKLEKMCKNKMLKLLDYPYILE